MVIGTLFSYQLSVHDAVTPEDDIAVELSCQGVSLAGTAGLESL
jgi:hypothetical protein